MKNTNTSSLINIAARLLSGTLQQNLINNNIDISVEQWRLLYYLWEKDGITQKELAKIANKEKSTITRQVSELEKKGYIIKDSNGSDKRNNLIYVSKKGKAIKTKALSLADDITIKAESNIEKQELDTFIKVLHKYISNIQ